MIEYGGRSRYIIEDSDLSRAGGEYGGLIGVWGINDGWSNTWGEDDKWYGARGGYGGRSSCWGGEEGRRGDGCRRSPSSIDGYDLDYSPTFKWLMRLRNPPIWCINISISQGMVFHITSSSLSYMMILAHARTTLWRAMNALYVIFHLMLKFWSSLCGSQILARGDIWNMCIHGLP